MFTALHFLLYYSNGVESWDPFPQSFKETWPWLGKAWHSYTSYYQIEYWLKSRTRSSPYLAKQDVLKMADSGATLWFSLTDKRNSRWRGPRNSWTLATRNINKHNNSYITNASSPCFVHLSQCDSVISCCNDVIFLRTAESIWIMYLLVLANQADHCMTHTKCDHSLPHPKHPTLHPSTWWSIASRARSCKPPPLAQLPVFQYSPQTPGSEFLRFYWGRLFHSSISACHNYACSFA